MCPYPFIILFQSDAELALIEDLSETIGPFFFFFFPAKFICTTHDKASYGHSNSVIKAVNNYFKSSFNKKIFYLVESNPYIMVYT